MIKIIDKGGYSLTNHRVNYRRAVLWLGQTCNQRCYFCYFANIMEEKGHPEKPFMSLEKAKEICKTLRFKYNNNSIDIQGGEPTIYPHIFELMKYCNEIGLKPTLITNALVLDDIEKCKKFKEAGVFDFLISVHNLGEAHDEVVKVPGSHKRQMKAIDNLMELDIPFRFNIVLTNEVLPNLQLIAGLAEKKGARACNFIAFNCSPGQEGKRNKDNVTLYSKIKTVLPPVIDYLDEREIEVNLRYLPFCLFEPKYRKFIQDTKQTIYDLHEWEYTGRLWTQDKPQRRAADPLDEPPNLFKYLLERREGESRDIARFFEENPHKYEESMSVKVKEPTKQLTDIAVKVGDYKPLFFNNNLGYDENLTIYDYAYIEFREISACTYRYKKLDKCNSCEITGICDGFHKDYVEFWGDEEAIPEKSIGKKIYDPRYYMKDQMKVVEKEEYNWALPQGEGN